MDDYDFMTHARKLKRGKFQDLQVKFKEKRMVTNILTYHAC